MKIRCLLVMGMALLLAEAPVGAQTATKAEKSKPPSDAKATKKIAEPADLAAIRGNSLEFAKAFNAGDAAGVAAHWTKDGDYTNEAGEVFSGREAIEKEYAKFFAAQPGVKIQIAIDSLRLLNDGVAIEDGRVILEPAPPGAGTSRYLAVHVKAGGQWLMSAVRDTRIEGSSTAREVDDLDWLVGTWTAEEYGSRTESVCRWVANKNFVERTYTVTRPDDTKSSGIQLIGFNPQSGRLQSWSFTSDGGFAVGVWSRRENGWAAEIEGTTGDGLSTTAVNLLTRLDDNAYTWQSVSRTAGGVSLPDTEEVVLKRSPSAR